jgi:8-oxo-dGTP pyrophosphatase MutT (NUDIX family)
MNIFDSEEFMQICNEMGAKPYIEEITLNYKGSSFFKKVKKSVKEDRRGEVVFCVIRPNGKIITVTCAEYPEGVFRIPTGGIGHKEDIIAAVFRETKEELGIESEILMFGGALKIRFEYGTEYEMFFSYIFIMKEKSGNLLVDAVDDEVSAIREVDLDGLEEIVKVLDGIQGQWSDWGKFRSVTTGAVLRILRRNPELLI